MQQTTQLRQRAASRRSVGQRMSMNFVADVFEVDSDDEFYCPDIIFLPPRVVNPTCTVRCPPKSRYKKSNSKTPKSPGKRTRKASTARLHETPKSLIKTPVPTKTPKKKSVKKNCSHMKTPGHSASSSASAKPVAGPSKLEETNVSPNTLAHVNLTLPEPIFDTEDPSGSIAVKEEIMESTEPVTPRRSARIQSGSVKSMWAR